MGHPFFGVESRMGVVNIFGEEGWNGRPSIKLGWYTSLVLTFTCPPQQKKCGDRLIRNKSNG